MVSHDLLSAIIAPCFLLFLFSVNVALVDFAFHEICIRIVLNLHHWQWQLLYTQMRLLTSSLVLGNSLRHYPMQTLWKEIGIYSCSVFFSETYACLHVLGRRYRTFETGFDQLETLRWMVPKVRKKTKKPKLYIRFALGVPVIDYLN